MPIQGEITGACLIDHKFQMQWPTVLGLVSFSSL